jgi:two-component system, cell cycle response regulator
MRILVADDDGVARLLLTKMLQHFGYEVVLAHDGNHAWQLMQQPNAPYLMLSDWMMPGMDGVTLCAKLKALDRDIPPYIVMLTSLNNKEDLAAGFKAGADDYMTKPFDPNALYVRIRAGERILNLQMESLAAREALRKQATYDFLTGLRNHDAILNELQRECETSARTGLPMSVVMADIDNFKTINDNYSLQIGDKVLAEAAKRMAAEARTYESIGRYDGNKFLIVLAECDLTGADKMAERVRNAISARECDILGTKIHVTVSLGVASSSQIARPTPEPLIEMAERAMYRAKQEGRNRVELAHDNFMNDAAVSGETSAV